MPERAWNCDKPPQFEGTLGIDFARGYSIGWYHESYVRCGSHNMTNEVYEDGFMISKKFGGHK